MSNARSYPLTRRFKPGAPWRLRYSSSGIVIENIDGQLVLVVPFHNCTADEFGIGRIAALNRDDAAALAQAIVALPVITDEPATALPEG